MSEPKYYRMEDLDIENWTNTIRNALSESEPTTFALVIMNN